MRRQLEQIAISYRNLRVRSTYAKEVPAGESSNCFFLALCIFYQYNAVTCRDKIHFLSILTLSDDHILWHEDLHLQERDDVLNEILIG